MKVAVQALLDEVQARQAEQLSRESDRARYAQFLGLRNEALFHDTQFTGLDLPSNQEATRRAARAALALYAVVGLGRFLGAGTAAVELVRSRAGRDRRWLLHAPPGDGRGRAHARSGPAPAGPGGSLAATHDGRTTCGGRPAWPGRATWRKPRRNAASRISFKPTTAFDHFLIGQEAYKRQDWIGALRHFDQAIQLQRDQFWAHALSALCWLQLKGPVQAKASLNTCLEREPEFAWLYILRGFASSSIPAHSPQEVALGFENAEADYDRARELLDRKPNDELRYILLVNRGVLRFQHGKLDQAATDLQAAIRLNDRSSQAYAALAEVYWKQGKPDEAVEQFGLAIERRPDWAPLYRGRADVHSRSQGADSGPAGAGPGRPGPGDPARETG